MNNTLQRYPQIKTGCWDLLPGYYEKTSIVLGVIMLLFGLLSMALGVSAICTLASGYYIAYGIWCGFVFTVTGIICILAGYKKNVCLVMTTLVFCLVSIFCGTIQFSLGVVAADNDSVNKRHDIIFKPLPEGYLAYDIYYARNNPYEYLCSGPNKPFSWTTSWGPVDVLLLLAGFIELVVAIAVAAITCHSTCNSHRDIMEASHTGFANEAYMTEARMSPPLYKVGM